MTDFFIALYSFGYSRNDTFCRLPVYSFYRFVIRSLANFFLPAYFKIINNPSLSNNLSGDQIIVSLTTFPTRINRLWIVIETIFHQTKRPNKIVLYLSKCQFPTLKQVPKSLLKMQSRGLSIILVDDDFKSHKKYLYSFEEYKDSLIITIDDDIFYSRKMIEGLFEKHKTCPRSIICNHGHQISRDPTGELLPYRDWNRNSDLKNLKKDIFFGTGGGTLFPTKLLPNLTTQRDIILELCPNADDVWLNTVARYSEIEIMKLDRSFKLLPLRISNNISLASLNLQENKNDEQLESTRRYFIHKFGKDPYLN